MFLKIFFTILCIMFVAILCWISYVAGMARGFKNFMTNKKDAEFTKLDAAIYQQVSGKKLEDINPVAEMIADKRIQDFKDKRKIEKRNAVTKKIKKKSSKKKK